MKRGFVQQEKRTSKDKYPFASDDEQNYDDSVESSDQDSSDSQVIDTRILRTPPVTQEPAAQKPENVPSTGTSSSVPSFHIQKSLNVNAAFAKIMFDVVKKGDIEAVKSQENRIGLDIQFLYDDQFKQNALFTALQIKEDSAALKMIEWLVQKGCPINFADIIGQTVLFYAARDGRLNMIKNLIQLGSEINHLDSFGQTCFFYACREGQLEVCNYLSLCGCDIDLQDKEGQTPLYYSIRKGKDRICQFLIDKGADVSHEDHKHNTPYILARRNAKHAILKMLVENGAKAYIDDVPRLPLKTPPTTKKTSAPSKPATQLMKQGKEILLNHSLSLQSQQQSISSLQIGGQNSDKKSQSTIDQNYQAGLKNKPYVLTVLKDGEYQPLSEDEMLRFFKRFPHLGKYWTEQPDSLNQLPVNNSSNISYESWDLVAKRILSQIQRAKHAKIFSQAIDCDQTNVLDFHEAVKNPIDLNMVKQRLHSNQYHNMQEFIDQIQLVFDTFEQLNGRDTVAGKQSSQVREEFMKLYEQLNVEFYII